MIGVPAIDQFVETMIFDVPSLVAKLNATFDGSQFRGERGHPDPIADERLTFMIELALDRTGLRGTAEGDRLL